MRKVEARGTDGTASRVYGVLATSLNEVLAEARQALEPHADLLPAGRLADLDALLAEFARRRVRVALYGEVKAGKSTLLNALAGAELSPVAFDPLTSVPLRVTYGAETTWRVGERTFDHVGALEQVMRDSAGGAGEVVVETDLDLLQLGGQVDLLDTPGVGSDERFDLISAETLRSLDAVVLVVRYPALFTQVTRRLMDQLQSDIGKLFVVWNLDAACAELTPEERTRHAERLRADVAGAHELYLVDARIGFRAARGKDSGGIAASGLGEFSAALTRFAASDKRQVAALREAAKRALQWLDGAHMTLAERQAALDVALKGVRARLGAVQKAADADVGRVRAQLAEFRAAVAKAGNQRAAGAAAGAAELGKRLRRARRRWILWGDFEAAETALAEAASAYADAVEETCNTAIQALREAARRFGTVAPITPRGRTVPDFQPLAHADRIERAHQGHGRLLRRALWRRWYLPGVAALEDGGVSEDLASQTGWFTATAKAAADAAEALLDARLAEIARRAETEMEKIKVETNFAADTAEFEALDQHLPIVAAKRASVIEINTEARALTG